MATLELYRRSTIGMFLTEILDEMVSNCTLSPELAIQVLVQFDKRIVTCQFCVFPLPAIDLAEHQKTMLDDLDLPDNRCRW
ncbi:hypothetical protein V6N13_120540 [Hibiscus sabdariffa]